MGLCFAYYCSGHGFGHATRVSAFACHLLSLNPKPTIHIVSSAPKYVFSDSVALGALYRSANIDPVIVQPLAYRVDRQKSIDVLKAFLETKDLKLKEEKEWLVEIGADCVLSDAAFLGCLAANAAGLPSVLITNFTFDSVFSYLSAPLRDDPKSSAIPSLSNTSQLDLQPDEPIPQSVLAPLVDEIHAGYRCADLLMLLPGAIPIPSFARQPMLPSPDWIDWEKGEFLPDVERHLTETSGVDMHPIVPFASTTKRKAIERKIIQAPLLVRLPNHTAYPSPSTSTSARKPLSPYTSLGRSALLSSIGVPSHLHPAGSCKILVVSFGGQKFKRVGSKAPSRTASPTPPHSPTTKENLDPNKVNAKGNSKQMYLTIPLPTLLSPKIFTRSPHSPSSWHSRSRSDPLAAGFRLMGISPRLATSSHIFIPGAPPASKHNSLTPTSPQPGSPLSKTVFTTMMIPPSTPGSSRGGSPRPDQGSPSFTRQSSGHREKSSSLSSYHSHFPLVEHPGSIFTPESLITSRNFQPELQGLLPDDSWIAIVCGVSKEQWNAMDENGDEGLPEGFYVAPKDVYMPDLTAIADVLLGKLGYGTVSECVDSCTPFVYVSRPLFVEEHGLRLLLSRSGVGVELSREDYEAGEWAGAVDEAWIKGRANKCARNKLGTEAGEIRMREGREMARTVVEWVESWYI